MNYRIIGDSCMDLTEEQRKDPHFTLIPFTLMVEDHQFIDDENFDQKRFLQIVKESPECPKTACPSPETFKDALCCEEENVFIIAISSHLSGCYNLSLIHIYRSRIVSFFTRTTRQSPRLRETLAVVAIRRGNSRSMFLFVGGESYGGDHLYYEYRQCRAICQDPGAGNRTSCIFNERGTKKDPTRCRRDLPGLDHGRYHKRIFSGCQALSGAGCLCRRNGTYGNADGRCPEKELHSRGVPAFYHTGKF